MPDPRDIALGLRIKALREERGISQGDVSLEARVSIQQIQKYESGACRISYSRLAMIAAALDMTVTDIVAPLDAPLLKPSTP